MSYSTNDLDATRRAATYVDKILKGTRPVNLPVEQSIKYEMVINVWERAPRSGIWTCFYYPEPVKF